MILQGEYEKQKGIRYEFDRFQQPVGEGGMGVVFKGVMIDEGTDVVLREVAIKEVKAEGTTEHIADILAKARRESNIRLRNDNLIEMLGFIEVEELKLNCSKIRYYVISEFLEGVTLVDVLQGNFTDNQGNHIEYAKQLSDKLKLKREETAELIIRKILYGITALHDNGYIHRDLDPSNIMVTKDGKIKIIDFGIAKRLNDLTTADGQKSDGRFVGKVDYAAPELINCEVKKQNFATDIYAIGVLFYLLLTNTLPFAGNRFDVMNAQLKKKVDVSRIISRKYQDIVRKSMAKNQEDRYATSSEMRVALDLPFTKDNKIKPYHFITASVGLAAFIGLIVFVFYLDNEPEPNPDEPVNNLVTNDEDIHKKQKDTFVIDVSKYLQKDRASLWNDLETSPDNSAVLYSLAKYYNDTRADDIERAKKYWTEVLVPEGYVSRNILRSDKRGFSTKRLAFLMTVKAMDNVERGNYPAEFKSELKEYLDSFVSTHPGFYKY